MQKAIQQVTPMNFQTLSQNKNTPENSEVLSSTWVDPDDATSLSAKQEVKEIQNIQASQNYFSSPQEAFRRRGCSAPPVPGSHYQWADSDVRNARSRGDSSQAEFSYRRANLTPFGPRISRAVEGQSLERNLGPRNPVVRRNESTDLETTDDERISILNEKSTNLISNQIKPDKISTKLMFKKESNLSNASPMLPEVTVESPPLSMSSLDTPDDKERSNKSAASFLHPNWKSSPVPGIPLVKKISGFQLASPRVRKRPEQNLVGAETLPASNASEVEEKMDAESENTAEPINEQSSVTIDMKPNDQANLIQQTKVTSKDFNDTVMESEQMRHGVKRPSELVSPGGSPMVDRKMARAAMNVTLRSKQTISDKNVSKLPESSGSIQQQNPAENINSIENYKATTVKQSRLHVLHRNLESNKEGDQISSVPAREEIKATGGNMKNQQNFDSPRAITANMPTTSDNEESMYESDLSDGSITTRIPTKNTDENISRQNQLPQRPAYNRSASAPRPQGVMQTISENNDDIFSATFPTKPIQENTNSQQPTSSSLENKPQASLGTSRGAVPWIKHSLSPGDKKVDFVDRSKEAEPNKVLNINERTQPITNITFGNKNQKLEKEYFDDNNEEEQESDARSVQPVRGGLSDIQRKLKAIRSECRAFDLKPRNFWKQEETKQPEVKIRSRSCDVKATQPKIEQPEVKAVDDTQIEAPGKKFSIVSGIGSIGLVLVYRASDSLEKFETSSDESRASSPTTDLSDFDRSFPPINKNANKTMHQFQNNSFQNTPKLDDEKKKIKSVRFASPDIGNVSDSSTSMSVSDGNKVYLRKTQTVTEKTPAKLAPVRPITRSADSNRTPNFGTVASNAQAQPAWTPNFENASPNVPARMAPERNVSRDIQNTVNTVENFQGTKISKATVSLSLSPQPKMADRTEASQSYPSPTSPGPKRTIISRSARTNLPQQSRVNRPVQSESENEQYAANFRTHSTSPAAARIPLKNVNKEAITARVQPWVNTRISENFQTNNDMLQQGQLLRHQSRSTLPSHNINSRFNNSNTDLRSQNVSPTQSSDTIDRQKSYSLTRQFSLPPVRLDKNKNLELLRAQAILQAHEQRAMSRTDDVMSREGSGIDPVSQRKMSAPPGDGQASQYKASIRDTQPNVMQLIDKIKQVKEAQRLALAKQAAEAQEAENNRRLELERVRNLQDLADRNKFPQDLVDRNRVPQNMVDRNKVPQDMIDRNKVPQDLVDRNRVPQNVADRNRVPQDLVDRNRGPQDLVDRNWVAQNVDVGHDKFVSRPEPISNTNSKEKREMVKSSENAAQKLRNLHNKYSLDSGEVSDKSSALDSSYLPEDQSDRGQLQKTMNDTRSRQMALNATKTREDYKPNVRNDGAARREEQRIERSAETAGHVILEQRKAISPEKTQYVTPIQRKPETERENEFENEAPNRIANLEKSDLNLAKGRSASATLGALPWAPPKVRESPGNILGARSKIEDTHTVQHQSNKPTASSVNRVNFEQQDLRSHTAVIGQDNMQLEKTPDRQRSISMQGDYHSEKTATIPQRDILPTNQVASTLLKLKTPEMQSAVPASSKNFEKPLQPQNKEQCSDNCNIATNQLERQRKPVSQNISKTDNSPLESGIQCAPEKTEPNKADASFNDESWDESFANRRRLFEKSSHDSRLSQNQIKSTDYRTERSYQNRSNSESHKTVELSNLPSEGKTAPKQSTLENYSRLPEQNKLQTGQFRDKRFRSFDSNSATVQNSASTGADFGSRNKPGGQPYAAPVSSANRGGYEMEKDKNLVVLKDPSRFRSFSQAPNFRTNENYLNKVDPSIQTDNLRQRFGDSSNQRLESDNETTQINKASVTEKESKLDQKASEGSYINPFRVTSKLNETQNFPGHHTGNTPVFYGAEKNFGRSLSQDPPRSDNNYGISGYRSIRPIFMQGKPEKQISERISPVDQLQDEQKVYRSPAWKNPGPEARSASLHEASPGIATDRPDKYAQSTVPELTGRYQQEKNSTVQQDSSKSIDGRSSTSQGVESQVKKSESRITDQNFERLSSYPGGNGVDFYSSSDSEFKTNYNSQFTAAADQYGARGSILLTNQPERFDHKQPFASKFDPGPSRAEDSQFLNLNQQADLPNPRQHRNSEASPSYYNRKDSQNISNLAHNQSQEPNYPFNPYRQDVGQPSTVLRRPVQPEAEPNVEDQRSVPYGSTPWEEIQSSRSRSVPSSTTQVTAREPRALVGKTRLSFYQNTQQDSEQSEAAPMRRWPPGELNMNQFKDPSDQQHFDIQQKKESISYPSELQRVTGQNVHPERNFSDETSEQHRPQHYQQQQQQQKQQQQQQQQQPQKQQQRQQRQQQQHQQQQQKRYQQPYHQLQQELRQPHQQLYQQNQQPTRYPTERKDSGAASTTRTQQGISERSQSVASEDSLRGERYLRLPEQKLKISDQLGRAAALYSFTGRSERELTFHKGDELNLMRRIDNNWYEASCNGEIGLVPANYIQERARLSQEGHSDLNHLILELAEELDLTENT